MPEVRDARRLQQRRRGLDGAVILDAGAGNFAFHADASGRHADDYRIPRYPYLPPRDQTLPFNGRQPNSWNRSDGQSIGGSYIFDSGFVGVSVSRMASLYRVPGLELTETNTRIDMNQTKIASRGEYRPQANGVEAIRFWFGHTDYKHNELANEGGFDGVQQTFTNKEQEGRIEMQLLPFDLRFATLTTALGVQGMHQRLNARAPKAACSIPTAPPASPRSCSTSSASATPCGRRSRAVSSRRT